LLNSDLWFGCVIICVIKKLKVGSGEVLGIYDFREKFAYVQGYFQA